jgi:serine protease Do
MRYQRWFVGAAMLALGAASEMWAQPAPAPAPPAPQWEGLLRMTSAGPSSYLGVGVQEVTADRAKTLKLKEEYGVEITRVEENSPASKAGLQVGDVVLEYNGQRVEGTEQFIRMVRETPVGRSARLLVSRQGGTMTLQASIGARKSTPLAVMPPVESWKFKGPDIEVLMPDIPKANMSWRSGTLGVEAESLRDSQLGDFFGAKEGVLVRSVLKNSAAEKAGIRAGDVILSVDDNKVTSPREVTAAVRSAREAGRKSVSTVVMREKRETTLSIPLEDEPATAPKAKPVEWKQNKL